MSGTIYDSNGTVDLTLNIAGSTTVTATHDGGTPSGQQPVVTFNVGAAFLSTTTINATNGAEAIVNQTISVLSTLNLNANSGDIVLGNFLSTLSTTKAAITNGGTFDTGTTTLGVLGSVTSTYGTGGGTLIIGGSGGILNLNALSINGFGGTGDIVEDKAITFSQVDSYKITTTGGNKNGTETYTFYSGAGGGGTDLGSFTVNGHPFKAGTYAVNGGPLGLSADSSGNLVTEGCFLAGTRIATPSGERLVESIAVGDLVTTVTGETVAVTWVGHRTIERAKISDADLRAPVVIAAGAFAPGLPARDLRLTPDHAILVNDRLIPARLLINGTTIRHEAVETYTYFHIELPAHGMLLAEGLAAESYLDCSDRGRFANSDIASLQPAAQIDAAAVYAAHGYRPLTLDAATVQPIWQTLADRAATLGHAADAPATTADAGLHLLVDGRRIAPVAVDGARVIFALPAGAASVAIVSRAARPSRISPWLDDRRRLGVQVARAVVRDGIAATDIAMDGPAARAGWHAIERGASRLARWTDGRGELALPPVTGPATLELTIAPMAAYPAADLAIAA